MLSGYCAGATLSQVGTTDQYKINYNRATEAIALTGVTNLPETQYIFT